MNVFELVVYFNAKHYNITSIKANDYDEAVSKAYRRFNHKEITKIEPFIRKAI